MLKFIFHFSFALACLGGLFAAALALLLLTTPRPNELRGCLTTEMFKVRLCPKERGYTKIAEVSGYLKSAIIVAEDGAFYTHQGVDWFELRESFNKNIEKGEFARGGSTITQQLAKNVYLSSEKSLLRKVRELIITIQIEGMLSKDEILEKYLNVVEFGDKIYGVEKAARHYFNKRPTELSIAESAFLAFLLPSPKRYATSFQKKKLSPFAAKRMQEIVGRMHRFKKISDQEHDEGQRQILNFFGTEIDLKMQLDGIEPSLEEADQEI